ncbi:hypothetical protein BDY17DRAFT_326294 [Neohortaea acidophila]|uniref:HAD-like domain-containing protein n=1 Tax=Neohortaea acidophila TaxID=245834 RepID=A0A6A6PKQ7_9PEZI|nr:uncharacterized protein BDY17DRAFT_326294 [Neohortaea acidophila]KAF2480386.1 hypothetical protein BDY17DRAFT_326294 [Neohortaea acidophila]
MATSTHSQRLHLILDFDGTITTSDTTPIIGSRLLSEAQNCGATTKSMKYYTDRYMQDHQTWKAAQARKLEDCGSVDAVVDFVSEVVGVERASFARVREGILGGGMQEYERDEAKRNDFMLRCGREAIRDGEVGIRDLEALRQLLQVASAGRNAWGVVSVSWSKRFILGALIEAGLIPMDGKEAMAERIKCNEILAPPRKYDEDGRPVTISSARDKLDAMGELLAEWKTGHPNAADTILVYVGDSSTDIGCLARADVGCYIHTPDSSLNAYIARLVDIEARKVTVNDLPRTKSSTNEHSQALCAVEGFEELAAWASKTFRSPN